MVNKIQEKIMALHDLDYSRRIKNLRRWMKRHGVEKAGSVLTYRNIKCMVTVVDGRFPVSYVVISPERSDQKITKHYGASKTIDFK